MRRRCITSQYIDYLLINKLPNTTGIIPKIFFAHCIYKRNRNKSSLFLLGIWLLALGYRHQFVGSPSLHAYPLSFFHRHYRHASQSSYSTSCFNTSLTVNHNYQGRRISIPVVLAPSLSRILSSISAVPAAQLTTTHVRSCQATMLPPLILVKADNNAPQNHNNLINTLLRSSALIPGYA